jgi:hypothetical protein
MIRPCRSRERMPPLEPKSPQDVRLCILGLLRVFPHVVADEPGTARERTEGGVVHVSIGL